MKRNVFIVLLLSMMGILLTIGCFGVYFVIIEESPSMGKRLSEYDSLFTGFSLTTELTPGEPTVTIKKGWFERKKVGLFVVGGFQRLVLDRVTITTSQKPQIDLSPKRLSVLLAAQEGTPLFSLAEIRRLELKMTKPEGGDAFFRAALAEVYPGKDEAILLQDAWFRDRGSRWERLRKAWIERVADTNSICLKMSRLNGSLVSLPLSLSL